MLRRQSRKRLFHFLISISLFSLLLISAIALFPPEIQAESQWRKQPTGLLLIFICALGMTSVFFPKQCSKIFNDDETITPSDVPGYGKENLQRSSEIFGVALTHGHHPECQSFHHHEFRISEKTYCVACMGLFFGAVMAIFGAFPYFFFEWLAGIDALVLVAFGVAGVALCLMHYTFFDVHSRLLRFFLNIFFIFGMFLILAGIDNIVQSLTLNFFLICLFVFWLFTRILLSKNKHEEICQNCNLDCSLKKIGN